MPTLLDVQAMPRQELSRTRKLHGAFMGAFLEGHPETEVVTVDVARHFDELPAIDEWDIQAKFEVMYGDGTMDPRTAERWDAVIKHTDRLHRSDLVVVSAPMWNLGIPWLLKRWIDTVVQARLTFEYVNGQYQGLLQGRPAVVLTTRDGAYRRGSPVEGWDFHVPYLRQILGFMGLGPIHVVVGEPMALMGPEAGKLALDQAMDEARTLARTL